MNLPSGFGRVSTSESRRYFITIFSLLCCICGSTWAQETIPDIHDAHLASLPWQNDNSHAAAPPSFPAELSIDRYVDASVPPAASPDSTPRHTRVVTPTTAARWWPEIDTSLIKSAPATNLQRQPYSGKIPIASEPQSTNDVSVFATPEASAHKKTSARSLPRRGRFGPAKRAGIAQRSWRADSDASLQSNQRRSHDDLDTPKALSRLAYRKISNPHP
jgi:hypothetical protein